MPEENDISAKNNALKSIISNVKRLINDADILLEKGSTGSAMSLAILAFEEAGKGFDIEFDIGTPKNSNLHKHRHYVSFFVLFTSLAQKYGLQTSGITEKITARWKDNKIELSKYHEAPPMSAELRESLRGELLPQIQKMSTDKREEFSMEVRWIEKISLLVQGGQIEKLRQSGFYLDVDKSFKITSTPQSIQSLEATRWLWAASRALNLLENGDFLQAYNPALILMQQIKNKQNKTEKKSNGKVWPIIKEKLKTFLRVFIK